MAESKEEKVNGGISGGTGKSSGGSEPGSKGNLEKSSEGTGGKSGQANVVSGDSVGQDGGKSGTSNGGSNGQRGGSNTGSVPSSGGSSRRSNGTSGGNSTEGSNNGTTEKQVVSSPPVNGLKPKDVRPSRSASSKGKETTKKNDGDISDPETISILIQTGFGLIAGFTKRRHWEVDPDEALSIAKPASALIQKLTSKQRQKINQLAAPILLGSAVAAVILPRLLLDIQMSKEVKQIERVKKQVNEIQSGTSDARNQQVNGNPESIGNIAVTNSSINTSVDSEIAGLFGTMD